MVFVVRIFDIEFWRNAFNGLIGLGQELWVGCAIVGLIAGIASYFVSRQGVIGYRERRRRRLLRRELLRSNPLGDKIKRRSEPI